LFTIIVCFVFVVSLVILVIMDGHVVPLLSQLINYISHILDVQYCLQGYPLSTKYSNSHFVAASSVLCRAAFKLHSHAALHSCFLAALMQPLPQSPSTEEIASVAPLLGNDSFLGEEERWRC
jgi:hypothetical protein